MKTRQILDRLFDKVDDTLTDDSVIPQDITKWIWDEKYRWKDHGGKPLEQSVYETHKRVVAGVFEHDPEAKKYAPEAYRLMANQIWCPAGRIHAGAGTEKRVTLINCFVSPTIADSMDHNPDLEGLGIMDALKVAMLTQQMGGGIGMDFSTLRPNHALVKRTHSVSTGPLPFMHMWDAMCAAVKSSGHRRGAMMGVMRCDHPDIMRFVTEKREKGKLENFNVSVLVTDPFIEAVKNDSEWDLVFNVPRADGNHVEVYTKPSNGETVYVYERLQARDLWDMIIGNTYNYAEPGIIFIDRVNAKNNLYYCEVISATNPCGEQPLPPDGDCNLGAINLARLVLNAFTKEASFDYDALRAAVRIAVRFLDNVLDITKFPTEAQAKEAADKRRTGLGITGLGTALQLLCVRYGSDKAVKFANEVMKQIAITAYDESVNLAIERGPFPAFDADKYLEAEFVKKLPQELRDRIREHGIRNGVILTIAPTGTTSMYYGNISSGIEPTFAWHYERKVRQADGSLKTFGDVFDYGYLLFKETEHYVADGKMPNYMVGALELTVEDHLRMQAACQEWVDSSISKTINCPEDMEFEEFKEVYMQAYDLGCKGCTTYRPNDIRGSVLTVKSDKPKQPAVLPVEPRPKELDGKTYKVKWPGVDQAFYITINDHYVNGVRMPFEIFINSKSVVHQEWIMALTRMISAVFRRGGDVSFVVEELQQVHSATSGAFIDKKYVPSFVALIGKIIEEHFVKIGLIESSEPLDTGDAEVTEVVAKGEICPSCNAPTLTMQEGCKKCGNCGYSECG